jgi:hypothetical protein
MPNLHSSLRRQFAPSRIKVLGQSHVNSAAYGLPVICPLDTSHARVTTEPSSSVSGLKEGKLNRSANPSCYLPSSIPLSLARAQTNLQVHCGVAHLPSLPTTVSHLLVNVLAAMDYSPSVSAAMDDHPLAHMNDWDYKTQLQELDNSYQKLQTVGSLNTVDVLDIWQYDVKKPF